MRVNEHILIRTLTLEATNWIATEFGAITRQLWKDHLITFREEELAIDRGILCKATNHLEVDYAINPYLRKLGERK